MDDHKRSPVLAETADEPVPGTVDAASMPDEDSPQMTQMDFGRSRSGWFGTWPVRDEAAAVMRETAARLRAEADRLDREADRLVGPLAQTARALQLSLADTDELLAHFRRQQTPIHGRTPKELIAQLVALLEKE